MMGEDMRFAATYFDGETPTAHEAVVRIADDRLILEAGDLLREWPLSGLRRLAGDDVRTKRLRFAPSLDEDARIALHTATDSHALRMAAPHLNDPWPRPPRLRRTAWLAAGVAVSAVLVVAFVVAPAIAERAAATMPAHREIAFGDGVERILRQIDFMGATCSRREGDAALRALVAPLAEGARLRPEVAVVDNFAPNAVTLPGDNIRVFRGLIAQSQSPEELFGVLAHEMGHMKHRDPLRGALRAGGTAGVIGLLFGDFAGDGAIGAAAEGLLNASYSRAAERAADLYAQNALARQDVSTEPLAAFMERMGALMGDEKGYFDSHPGFAERAAMLREAGTGGAAKILSPEQWAALQAICQSSENDGAQRSGEAAWNKETLKN